MPRGGHHDQCSNQPPGCRAGTQVCKQLAPGLMTVACLVVSVQPERPQAPDQQGGAEVIADAHRQCFRGKQGQRCWNPEVGRVADAAAQLQIRPTQGRNTRTEPVQDHHHQRDGCHRQQCHCQQRAVEAAMQQQPHQAHRNAETHQRNGQRCNPLRSPSTDECSHDQAWGHLPEKLQHRRGIDNSI